ncbi:MAG: polysaccharide deacetylase family protein [Clostridia bacterium]
MILFKNKKVLCLIGILLFIAVSVFYLKAASQRETAAAFSPYYEGNTGNQQVSICINVDWGEDYIPGMLQTLEKHNAKATFFLTGRWTEKFPDVAESIKDAGMEIGNHGLKHKSPNAMSYEENLGDIQAAEQIIEDVLHISTVLFAPPSGEIDDQVQKAAEDAGYRLILWSVDTIDWQKPAKETIVERVKDKVQDGSIILMHPTENTAAALDDILILLESKGLRPVPVSELIK